jgi:hypothetical protein
MRYKNMTHSTTAIPYPSTVSLATDDTTPTTEFYLPLSAFSIETLVEILLVALFGAKFWTFIIHLLGVMLGSGGFAGDFVCSYLGIICVFFFH